MHLLSRLDTVILHKNLSKAAPTYDQAAELARQVGQSMLKRLDLVVLEPQLIVDIGCGTGYFTDLLKKRYKHSHLIALDNNLAMLEQIKRRNKWWQRQQPLIQADMQQLPFADHSVDLIFANLVLPWAIDLPLLMREWQRVLKPQGLLMFSSLGVDSLKELRASWAMVDDQIHAHEFLDMHEVGDALVQAGFLNPVLDVEYYTLTYPDVALILQDLTATGSQNVDKRRRKTLTGKNRFAHFLKAYESWRNEQHLLPLTYEIVFGHAWGRGPSTRASVNEQGVVSIPIQHIGSKKKS